MSSCFCCCIIRPSLLNQDPNYSTSWNSPPIRPNFPLTLKNDWNQNISSRLITRILHQDQQGLGFGVVSTDSSVALTSPVIDTKEEEVEHGLLNGVADTKSPTPSTKFKKKKEDDDSFENRFKLRNGREVRFF